MVFLTATFDNLLIQLKEDDSPIVIEKTSSELKRGEVVSVGPGTLHSMTAAQLVNGGGGANRNHMEFHEGDTVYFDERDAKIISKDGEIFYVLDQAYVYAREEEE